jgi:hypothetical protein
MIKTEVLCGGVNPFSEDITHYIIDNILYFF